MKVKATDAQRAVEIINENYLKSVGLERDDLSAVEAVFDVEAETVTCPACSNRFKPDTRSCPDCGLQFG